jgi:hypothetical protein
MAMTDEKLADYFRDLERPVSDIAAMTAIVLMVWRHPELGGPGRHSDRMDVALDRP